LTYVLCNDFFRLLFKNINKKYIHACCTGLCFTLMLISFHVMSRYVSGTWPTFISTSLVWELSHLGDGLILFTFNKELKRAIRHPRLLFSFTKINDTTLGTKGR
ncbi:hypothetical protein PMAYCL1PPCAC_04539, partial [Pristionchus mayeri]